MIGLQKINLLLIHFHSVVCNVCGNPLQTARITEEEIIKLRDEFFNNVEKSPDMQRKTTREEWQLFQKMIKEHSPFDIVMDGLNVVYKNRTKNENNSKLGKPKQTPSAIPVNSIMIRSLVIFYNKLLLFLVGQSDRKTDL